MHRVDVGAAGGGSQGGRRRVRHPGCCGERRRDRAADDGCGRIGQGGRQFRDPLSVAVSGQRAEQGNAQDCAELTNRIKKSRPRAAALTGNGAHGRLDPVGLTDPQTETRNEQAPEHGLVAARRARGGAQPQTDGGERHRRGKDELARGPDSRQAGGDHRPDHGCQGDGHEHESPCSRVVAEDGLQVVRGDEQQAEQHEVDAHQNQGRDPEAVMSKQAEVGQPVAGAELDDDEYGKRESARCDRAPRCGCAPGVLGIDQPPGDEGEAERGGDDLDDRQAASAGCRAADGDEPQAHGEDDDGDGDVEPEHGPPPPPVDHRPADQRAERRADGPGGRPCRGGQGLARIVEHLRDEGQ